MLIGNPYKFSIFVNDVEEWNLDESPFRNGIFLFCIDGEFFPKHVITATLSCEIAPIKEKLINVHVNDTFYKMEKEKSFAAMYDVTFPLGDTLNHYRYDISPFSLSDDHCYIFAVSNGTQTRIMAAKLNYIIEESTHDLTNIAISEAYLSDDELKEIITKLDIFLNQRE